MSLVVHGKHRKLETDASTFRFYSPPPRPLLKKTKKLPVRRFKRKFTSAKGFAIGGRVLGPIWDLFVPAVKTDPSLAPKQPTECELAIKALKKQLRGVGIPTSTPGVTYNEEIRMILQKRMDVYNERQIRHKVRTPYNSSTKRIRLMRKYCADRLTQMYERALLSEDFDTALLAIDLGAPANWMTRRGDTPLTITIKSEQKLYIQPFVSAGTPVDRADARGWTPLCIAVQRKEMEVAQMLLQLGADPNKESLLDLDTKETVSPLMIAVCHPSANVDIVYLLLQNGANVNQVNSKGRSPLMFACRWRQLSNARLLLEEYANPALLDVGGYTATEWVKYAARERIMENRSDKKTRSRTLRSAASDSSEVLTKIQTLLSGKAAQAEEPAWIQDEEIKLNILEEELVREMEQKMQQRMLSSKPAGGKMGIADIPAANAREGAAMELLKRGHSVFEVIAKWKEAIGGENASLEDMQRVLVQRVSEQKAETKKQLTRQSAVAAFSTNAIKAKRRRAEDEFNARQAEFSSTLAVDNSDALLEQFGIDDIVPEPNEWTSNPCIGGPVRRIKPNKWLGYDLDVSSFQMKPSASMLVLAAHPSALIRNFAKRLLRIRAAEVALQREEAAMKRFELRTGRSRAEIKTRGRTTRMDETKAIIGKIDAQLSAQVAFGNFLSGYEGATKAMMMSDIPEAEDPDEQAVLVLTQDQLCANCNKRAARLRDLNNNKRLCEKCTLWMSQQPGLKHHRFKPIPPPGMNDGIMAKRQEHKAKEAKSLAKVSGMVGNSISRMRQTFQRVKRDLVKGAHLLPPLEESPDGIEGSAFTSRSSTPRSVTTTKTALTGMDSAPTSPRQTVMKRLQQISNADIQAQRRASNAGDHPMLAAASAKKTAEELEHYEAVKAAKSSAVAAAAAHLLAADPEYPTAAILKDSASDLKASGGMFDLDTINRLSRVPERIESFEERHARINSRPGSSRWEMGVRGLFGQAARERDKRNKRKAELLKKSQMGDFSALEELKKLVETSSAISHGARGISREAAQRMADFAMLRARPQTAASNLQPHETENKNPPISPQETPNIRPNTGAPAHPGEKAISAVEQKVSRAFETFQQGRGLVGSHATQTSAGSEQDDHEATFDAFEAKRMFEADVEEKSEAEQARLAAHHAQEKREKLLQKKKERLMRMTADISAMRDGAAAGGEAMASDVGDEVSKLVKLAHSLENGHGMPASSPEDKKKHILRRAALMQGQPLSPIRKKDTPLWSPEVKPTVGRERLLNAAAEALGNLGFGAPGGGAHATEYFGQNLQSEFEAEKGGASGLPASSALDRLTGVGAAKRSMGGAVRNLVAEKKIQESAAEQQHKLSRMQEDARRATARLRVQALYTRPPEISLAYVLLEQAKFDDARTVLSDLMAKQKTTLPEMHMGFIATLVALGRLNVQTGMFEAAIQQLQEAQYLLSLHQIHPGNDDSFLAIKWLSAAYTGQHEGMKENAAVEAYVKELNAAYKDAEDWRRRKQAGAVNAWQEYENYNGQVLSKDEQDSLNERLVPLINSSRQHRELQHMQLEDLRRSMHSSAARVRRERRVVRAKLLIDMQTTWRIQQRWIYARCFDDLLYKEYPEVDPLTSEEAIEPARQKDEYEALLDLENRPKYYGADADTDDDLDSSGDEDSRPGTGGRTLQLKLGATDYELKTALSYSRWQQMLEKIAIKDGIEYSVKFLAEVLKYKSANYNRVDFGGDFEMQRRIETIRSNQAARIADLYIKHPQMLPIVPMNMRQRILELQEVSPLPFDIFEDAFETVWQQVSSSLWPAFRMHPLGQRFQKERLLALLLPTWSLSMIAKLAGKDLDTPVARIGAMVRGVQARKTGAQLLHKRYHQLLRRVERVPVAEEFLLKWMRQLGMSQEQIDYEQDTPGDILDEGRAYWEVDEDEEQAGGQAFQEGYDGTEYGQTAEFGVDEQGFPWQYDADGYVVFADKDGLQFYRDENNYAYFFGDDSQQIFFEPIPPSSAAIAHVENALSDVESDGTAHFSGPAAAESKLGTLPVIAEATTISEQPSLYDSTLSAQPSISSVSRPEQADSKQSEPVPKRKKSRPKRVFKTKAEAGRLIERIGRGFLGRIAARARLLQVFRCEYRPSADDFVYVDTRTGQSAAAPPQFLSADYPTTHPEEHPLMQAPSSSKQPLQADEMSASEQLLKQTTAFTRPAAQQVSEQDPAPHHQESKANGAYNAYPGVGSMQSPESKFTSAAAQHQASEPLGDGETWGFDQNTGYPWMMDEYGSPCYTDGASLTFYRDDGGHPFYYDENGQSVYCEESDLQVPSRQQVLSYFSRGDGTVDV